MPLRDLPGPSPEVCEAMLGWFWVWVPPMKIPWAPVVPPSRCPAASAPRL
jgi:hypothetical protein